MQDELNAVAEVLTPAKQWSHVIDSDGYRSSLQIKVLDLPNYFVNYDYRQKLQVILICQYVVGEDIRHTSDILGRTQATIEAAKIQQLWEIAVDDLKNQDEIVKKNEEDGLSF